MRLTTLLPRNPYTNQLHAHSYEPEPGGGKMRVNASGSALKRALKQLSDALSALEGDGEPDCEPDCEECAAKKKGSANATFKGMEPPSLVAFMAEQKRAATAPAPVRTATAAKKVDIGAAMGGQGGTLAYIREQGARK